MKKIHPCECPNCGESDGRYVSCLNTDIDGSTYREDWVCGKCNSYWIEYYSLIWNGYAFENKDYDLDGNVM